MDTVTTTTNPMNPYLVTVVLLVFSNVFMAFAWYGHLKYLALLQYLLQIPGNRVGHDVMSLGQLKILQEVITLTVFVPLVVLYMKEETDPGLPMGGIVFAKRGVFSIQDQTGALTVPL